MHLLFGPYVYKNVEGCQFHAHLVLKCALSMVCEVQQQPLMMANLHSWFCSISYYYVCMYGPRWICVCAKALSQKRCKHYGIDELSMGCEEFARKPKSHEWDTMSKTSRLVPRAACSSYIHTHPYYLRIYREKYMLYVCIQYGDYMHVSTALGVRRCTWLSNETDLPWKFYLLICNRASKIKQVKPLRQTNLQGIILWHEGTDWLTDLCWRDLKTCWTHQNLVSLPRSSAGHLIHSPVGGRGREERGSKKRKRRR